MLKTIEKKISLVKLSGERRPHTSVMLKKNVNMYLPCHSVSWCQITQEARGRLKVTPLKHGIDPNT